MSAYVKSYDDQTKRMYFLIGDDDLFEKQSTVWDKVSADIKKAFDNKPMYDNFFFKTTIKSYSDKAVDFNVKDTCLAVIKIYSAFKKDGHYYLKECKNIEKEKNVIRHITEDI